jgi:hypothetical protein
LRPDFSAVARAEASKTKRQVFWLPAQTNYPRLPLPQVKEWLTYNGLAEILTGYSGGPATDLHRFPMKRT